MSNNKLFLRNFNQDCYVLTPLNLIKNKPITILDAPGVDHSRFLTSTLFIKDLFKMMSWRFLVCEKVVNTM